MHKLSKALAESAEKSQHKQMVDLYSDLLTATYDKATSYLNVVTIGGYAAFFGLWGMLGAELSPAQRYWSAMLIGISVLLFVGFEVLKIAILHWQMRSMLKLSRHPPANGIQMLQARAMQWDRANQVTSKIAVGIWTIVFPATVLTGFAGAGILIYAFAAKLQAL